MSIPLPEPKELQEPPALLGLRGILDHWDRPDPVVELQAQLAQLVLREQQDPLAELLGRRVIRGQLARMALLGLPVRPETQEQESKETQVQQEPQAPEATQELTELQAHKVLLDQEAAPPDLSGLLDPKAIQARKGRAVTRVLESPGQLVPLEVRADLVQPELELQELLDLRVTQVFKELQALPAHLVTLGLPDLQALQALLDRRVSKEAKETPASKAPRVSKAQPARRVRKATQAPPAQ